MDDLSFQKKLKERVIEDIKWYEKHLDTFRGDRELREMLEGTLTGLYRFKKELKI